MFHYERQNDAPEIMKAVGPTSENLVVMVSMDTLIRKMGFPIKFEAVNWNTSLYIIKGLQFPNKKSISFSKA